MASEEGIGQLPRARQHREPQHRTLFVPIDDLDLNIPEGQDEMLKRMQTLLSTKDHNKLDLDAFKVLKDTVKARTDLNVLKLFTEMSKKLKEFEEHQKFQNA